MQQWFHKAVHSKWENLLARPKLIFSQNSRLEVPHLSQTRTTPPSLEPNCRALYYHEMQVRHQNLLPSRVYPTPNRQINHSLHTQIPRPVQEKRIRQWFLTFKSRLALWRVLVWICEKCGRNPWQPRYLKQRTCSRRLQNRQIPQLKELSFCRGEKWRVHLPSQTFRLESTQSWTSL